MQPAVVNLELSWDLPPDVTPVQIPAEIPAIITVSQRLTFFAMLQGVDMDVSALLTFEYFFAVCIIY